MKNQEVVITEKNIHFEDNDRSVVMDTASKGLMEMYSHIVCQNGGDVLDVGFGMGFSANKMYELSNSYTCIEINPQIYERAKKWAKDKLNVEIIFGDWIDVIPTLDKKFDGIFMDTHHDQNYNKFEKYCKLISKKECILSIFNYFSLRNKSEMNSYDYKLESEKFTKIVEPVHTINWTIFNGVDFLKTNNKIKSKQTYLI